MLYPPGLPAARRLARYVEVFDTVELNASFYRWPKDSTFAGWREQLPDGCTMSVKAHRGLTHYRRLASPEPWIERFERCWQLLGDRHGVLLVQLHPEQQRDDARLDCVPAQSAGVDPGGRRVAASVVERPCGISSAGTPPRRLRGDERRRTGMRSAGHHRSGVCPHARPGSGRDLRRLLFGRRAAALGRPNRRNGTARGGTCGCTSITTWAATRSAMR